MKNNKKKSHGKGLLVGASMLAGAFAAFNGVLLYQVMDRRGKLMGKMGEKMFPIDLDDEGNIKSFGTRTSWVDEAEHEDITLNNRGLSLKGYY